MRRKISKADAGGMLCQNKPFSDSPGPWLERSLLDPQCPKMRFCDNCGSTDASKLCNQCMNAYYCNRECQKAAWQMHRCVCSNNCGVASGEVQDTWRSVPGG